MTESSLANQLEAVLFVATEPLSEAQLATACEVEIADAQKALATLATQLASTGLRLSQLRGHYQLVTTPDAAPIVRRYLQQESRNELSRPALETLAIVAYQGPLTKQQIEAVRGVSSETMLRNLASRGLIVEAGRRKTEPGRPIEYAVSHAFLRHFGLTSPADLPPIPQETADEN